jgi:spectinomycin phosphotransferase
MRAGRRWMRSSWCRIPAVSWSVAPGRQADSFQRVRSLPAGLEPERLVTALAEGWCLRAASMQYVPEGGGSYHWKLTAGDDEARFVTVDDLDTKDWLGDSRDAAFEGLSRAMGTAAALRNEAGLDFVAAPMADCEGGLVRRVDDQYTVSVFPFLTGQSYPFGPYADAGLRDRVLDLIAALHEATPTVRGRAPDHVLRFEARSDLEAFFLDPHRPWGAGPFAAGAHGLLLARAESIARLAADFDRLADATAPERADQVITHGEPHPANLMSADGGLRLIDWDTVALAPPERDVCLIAAPGGNESVDRYQEATGRELSHGVITLYRLRWYLGDLSSAIRLLRNRHRDTADTRRWRDGLAPCWSRFPAGWIVWARPLPEVEGLKSVPGWSRPARIQRRPALITGFLGQTGLALEPEPP